MRTSHTTAAKVANVLAQRRSEGGQAALGKVLNLIAVVQDEYGVQAVVVSALNLAKAHPLRIIVLLPDTAQTDGWLDARIMDVGSAEVVILEPHGIGDNQVSLVIPLLLPDAPVFTWWVQEAPAAPGKTGLGRISQRRITSVNATGDAGGALEPLAKNYQPGDTDIAWAGLTIWRSQLAALLNEGPHEPIESVMVAGNTGRGGVKLLANWLALRLGVPVSVAHRDSAGIEAVEIHRESGISAIRRPGDGDIAHLSRPGRPDLQIAMPLRSLQAQLIEELRTVGEDSEYYAALSFDQ